MSTPSDPEWLAHAPRVLVSASRRNIFFFRTATVERGESPIKVRDREDALASTRNAHATRTQALGV
jgi:hypothetical protein